MTTARENLIAYAASTRTVTADGLDPLIDAVIAEALAAIATIANALGDSLPGDNWAAANAIHEIATGKVTPEQGLADAWPDED
jgi:hypothetical protein